MKTVKQIADEIGISKQRVYRYIKKNRISEVYRDVHRDTGKIQYDEVAETLIKQHFSSINRINEVHRDARRDALQTASLDTVISMLKAELDIKNEQIKDLNNRLSETTAALIAAQQSAQAEQLLHADTKKMLPGGHQADEREPVGFFARLFRRKKN